MLAQPSEDTSIGSLTTDMDERLSIAGDRQQWLAKSRYSLESIFDVQDRRESISAENQYTIQQLISASELLQQSQFTFISMNKRRSMVRRDSACVLEDDDAVYQLLRAVIKCTTYLYQTSIQRND